VWRVNLWSQVLANRAKKESGAERNSGNDRMRSYEVKRHIRDCGRRQRRRPHRTGRVRLDVERADQGQRVWIGAPLFLNGELGPPDSAAWRMYVCFKRSSLRNSHTYIHGLSAVLPSGLPDWMASSVDGF